MPEVECELCKKELDSDFVVVKKNGKRKWICKHHPRPKEY